MQILASSSAKAKPRRKDGEGMLVPTLPQFCSCFNLNTILGSQKSTESKTGICKGASWLLAAECEVAFCVVPEGRRPALGKVLGKCLFLKDSLIFS